MSTESRRIRVLLVDDHSVVLEGLQVVLERSGEFEVVGQAGECDEAVRAASELSPDVIVMDVMMPNKDGVEACREIMDSAPDTRVIMLTASTEEDAVREGSDCGSMALGMGWPRSFGQGVSGLQRGIPGEVGPFGGAVEELAGIAGIVWVLFAQLGDGLGLG